MVYLMANFPLTIPKISSSSRGYLTRTIAESNLHLKNRTLGVLSFHSQCLTICLLTRLTTPGKRQATKSMRHSTLNSRQPRSNEAPQSLSTSKRSLLSMASYEISIREARTTRLIPHQSQNQSPNPYGDTPRPTSHQIYSLSTTQMGVYIYQR